ncbi:ependymin-like [Labrus mixtus]|uniref:ependymin-like n=1 Tax=Labrus mixtus TaxID=508554 RepID=UPI0029C04A84|nr:ependymin-like [Labrus mixtus]
MKIFVALACLLAGCLAQEPQPCESPPQMSGEISVNTSDERLEMYGKYLYDALGQRIKLFEFRTLDNETFTYDLLLLYKEQVAYEINDRNRTCIKRPLKGDFMPLAVPKEASLLGQVVIGSSSAPGQGLLVNTWTGDLPKQGGKYRMTVTEFGCIPVTTSVQTKPFGWIVQNFFNNVIGISDPSQFNPPSYCPDANSTTKSVQEPLDFFDFFHRKN